MWISKIKRNYILLYSDVYILLVYYAMNFLYRKSNRMEA